MKLISVLAILAGASMTQAANIFWAGGTADYTNAADWVGGIVPGPSDNAINDNGTNHVVQISAGNPDWTVNQIRAGNGAGDGAFAQSGQTLSLTGTNGNSYITPFRLGVALNDTGVYTLNGGSINYSNGGFNVGELGTGVLNVNGGSILGSGNFADNIGGNATPVAVNATVGGGTGEGDFTWFEQGYYAGNPSAGLPAAGSTIISQAQADHSYNLPPSYTANNSVLLASNVTSATITLTAPATCTGLSFLATSGNGASSVNYTVHHADATTETGTLSIPDWFGPGTAQEVMAVGSRVDALGRNFQFPGPANGFTGNAPYLWSLDIPITDTGSAVTSIDLSYVSGGFANVFGLSSQTTGGGPFNPVAITGYNKDVVVEVGAITTTPNTVTDIVNQTAGAITVTNGGQLFIGNGGNAIYNLSGGSVDIYSWIALGRSSGNGTLNMTGGTFNQHGNGANLLVGTGFNNNGTPATGVLNQSGGTINSIGQFLCPENSPSTGTYNLNGTGALIANTWIAIGRNGGSGTVNMTNGSITKLGGAGDHITIGSGGAGALNQYGGVITNTTSDFFVGETANGTWNMNGGAAYLGQINICVGGSASGTLNLNGGTIQTTGIFSGSPGVTVSTLSFNGGTLQAGANNPNFISGLYQVLLGPSGATIDSQSFNIAIPEALSDGGGGGLTKNGTGTLTLSGANTYTGPTVVNAGALDVGTSASGAGAYTVADNQGLGVSVQSANGQLNVVTLSMSGSTAAALNVDLANFGNPSLAPLNVIGTWTASGNITVNVADALPQIGQFPLVKYGSLSGSPTFTLGSLPTGVTATLVNDTANSSIDLNITGVNAPRWDGQAGGNWDIGLTTNWVNIGTGQPTFYTEGSPILFDDNAAGVTTVNLTTTVHPASVTITNNSLNYTFVGSGSIGGAIGLNKEGSSTLTIGNNNSYTGPTMITGGTLTVSNLANGGSPSAIGASSASPNNLVISGGTFSYAGSPVSVNRGYVATNGVIDAESDFTLTGLGETLSGTLHKTGPATMTYADVGTNVLSPANVGGAYQVQNGTVVLDGSSGPQTNSVIGEIWVGGTPNFGANLVLTNTSLGVSSWLGLGRGNGTVGNVSTLTAYNSTISFGNVSLGYANGIAGNLATQFLTLNNSTIIDRGDMNLAESTGSSATITLNGTSLLSSQNRCYLGGLGGGNTTASMIVANSSQFRVLNGWFSIANNSGSVGSLLVKDNGLVLVTNGGTGDFNVTDVGAGSATATITNNGDIENWGGFYVGKAGGSTGEVDQYGGTVHAHNHGNQEFQIGANGTGTYNFYAGTITTDTKWFAVGRFPTGVGYFNVYGGSVTINNNALLVGEGGTGTLTITNGSVTSTSDFIIGNSDGNGTGTVNLNGGLLSVPIVHTFSTNVSTFNFNGGTLQARANQAPFLGGLSNVTVMAGGAVIDSGANTIGIPQPLLNGGGGGGLTKLGTGTLRLNGINAYTGNTLVSAGTLGGIGTIAGPVAVASGATLFPGATSAIGTLSINNSLTFSNGSTAFFRINNNNNGTNNDLVSGLTAVSYAGSLVVTNNGTNALVVGSVFQLFNSAGAGSGNFSSVTVLPAGSGTFNPATGQLTITGTGAVKLNSPFVSGGNLVITGTGAAGTGYTLLSSTNIALPLAQWTTNTTGTFSNPGGTSSNAIPLDQTNRFFLLRQP